MLRNRQGIISKSFTKGVSYKSGDIGDKLFDAINTILVQGKIQTRYGLRRFSSEQLAATPESLSYFTKLDGTTRKLICKAGTVMYSSPVDGVFSSIKTGLTTGNKHDAVTVNGRHIIAIGSDGMYSYDGTTFAALGITAPTAPTVAANNGAGTLTDKTYTVAITYEASGIGFETNIGTSSLQVTTSGGNDAIDVSAIPVSTHPLVDFKNVYLKNVSDSGAYIFVAQIANATTTYQITTNPDATAGAPPTGKDPPLAGGAKYLALFGGKVAAAGNTNFPDEIVFSEVDEPDAWPTTVDPLKIQGDGPITGIAVGYYNDSELSNYLVGFKKRSLSIYFEDITGDSTKLIHIPGVGCVSHKTIRIKDGNIYFLSLFGWRVIENGKLLDQTLAEGDVDDIFKTSGFTYGVNKTQLQNAFSVYYSEMDSYMTWLAEGSSSTLDKCYNYHMDLNTMMPQNIAATCACVGEDVDGNETVYIADSNRRVYTYNIRNPYYDEIEGEGFTLDVDQLDVDIIEDDQTRAISCFAMHNWMPEEDFDTSYNFRDYILEGISDTTEARSAATVKVFRNFSRSTVFNYDYSFYTQEGFILDVSRLDEGILADDRTRFRDVADINISAENILIGIFQNVNGARLQLLSHQLNYNKNGNRN